VSSLNLGPRIAETYDKINIEKAPSSQNFEWQPPYLIQSKGVVDFRRRYS
jgi:hypothetical protein